MTKTVLGIIGGSGVYDISGLEDARWERVSSPWGDPSDDLLFGNGQGRVVAFQIAGAVAGDAMAQDQILGTRRSADRVGLHKTERANRLMQPDRLEQRSRNCIAAQRR